MRPWNLSSKNISDKIEFKLLLPIFRPQIYSPNRLVFDYVHWRYISEIVAGTCVCDDVWHENRNVLFKISIFQQYDLGEKIPVYASTLKLQTR